MSRIPKQSDRRPPEPALRSGNRPPRLVGLLSMLGALVVGLAGAFSIAGTTPPSMPFEAAGSSKSSAVSQYKPGKGCGDKNHVHERENECKKTPK